MIVPGLGGPASSALLELDVILSLHRIEMVLWVLVAVEALLWGLTMVGLVLLARRRS